METSIKPKGFLCVMLAASLAFPEKNCRALSEQQLKEKFGKQILV